MRLIDADALINEIANLNISEQSKIFSVNMLRTAPTAYDVDAVVEELETYQNQHNAMCEQHKVKTIEDIYGKAIDDFVKECEAEYDNDGCPGVSDYLDYKLSLREIFEIAEQLKAGGVE